MTAAFLKSRRLFLAGLLVTMREPLFAGIRPGEVPLQDAGIATAGEFLAAIDRGDDGRAYSLLSNRVRQRTNATDFSATLRTLRARLGSAGYGRTLVGTVGRDPQVSLRTPNATAQAQWTLRFRSKYRAGALFEDVQLEFDETRNWAVGGWFFTPATY